MKKTISIITFGGILMLFVYACSADFLDTKPANVILADCARIGILTACRAIQNNHIAQILPIFTFAGTLILFFIFLIEISFIPLHV